MNPLIVPLKICPVAPTGVAAYTDQISGMVLWSVLWLFGIAALVSVGAILVGLSLIHISEPTRPY